MSGHLWLARISTVAGDAAAVGLAWLSDSERSRLDAITAAGRRKDFLSGRWGMRQLLANVFGGEPACDWPLAAAAHGPPRLVNPSAGGPLHLALSHSGEWLACAVSSAPLGLDIETPGRPRDIAAMIEAVCTETERERFAKMNASECADHFRIVWTLKEAHQKMYLEGISLDVLTRLETSRPCRSGGANANALVWQGAALTVALAADQGAPRGVELHFPDELALTGPASWAVRRHSSGAFESQ